MTATPALTIEQVLAALPASAATRFNDALVKLAQYEADDVILKSELVELRTYGFNRAFDVVWTTFVREPFFHDGRFQKLTEAESKLEMALGSYPECHTAAGYLKRVVAATKAEGTMRDTMIDVLNVLVPIAARMEALKSKIGKRAPKATKTSIERDERDAKAMTCQCCGRGILAETGVIAHHGYERPAGMGYQTASCPGAKELPFEVSRDALGRYIKALEDYVIRQDAFRSRVAAETTDIAWTYSDRSNCTARWQRGVDRMVQVNRATFRQVVADTKAAREQGREGATPFEPDFDRLKAATIDRIGSDITHTEAVIREQQARYDAWTQTHERQGDAWVAVAA